jgi:hypothetical protein
MAHEPACNDLGPRIGVFWFVSTDTALSRLVSLTWPADIDAERAELRAVPYDHMRAWPEVQRLDKTLANYEFDHFPRGRLEFYPPMRRWLLAIDAKLDRSSFAIHLITFWRLPPGHLTVTVDPAYTSAVSVPDP